MLPPIFPAAPTSYDPGPGRAALDCFLLGDASAFYSIPLGTFEEAQSVEGMAFLVIL